jgi:hypothetical protein
MFKLLRNRWLHRTLFLGVLVALGVGIFHFEQPMPMCEIDAGNPVPCCFADNGRRFMTVAATSDVSMKGPLQIWDCHTGAEISRHFENDYLVSPIFSKNGRRFAGETIENEEVEKGRASRKLHLVDLADGTALDMALEDDAWGKLRFTPTGDLLMRVINSKEGRELQLYESASGRLLGKYISELLEMEEPTDEMILFRTRTPPAGWSLEIWSVPERRSLATLPDAGAPICSRDGKFLAFERIAGNERPTGAWVVWNTASARIEAEFQMDEWADVIPAISPKNRWLVSYGKGFVELLEFPSCKPIAKLPKDLVDRRVHFSPDGRCIAMLGWNHGMSMVLAETPTLDVRWEKADSPMRHPFLFREFSTDSRTLLSYQTAAPTLIARDSETGETRAHVHLVCDGDPKLTMTPDQKMLLIHQTVGSRKESWVDRLPWASRLLPTHTDCVVLVGTNACQERFRITGMKTNHAMLSDDGNTLVTQHDGMIRCWDVNAWKPLYWPIGVPAGLAVLGVLIAWWRGRRRV